MTIGIRTGRDKLRSLSFRTFSDLLRSRIMTNNPSARAAGTMETIQ